MDFLLVRADDIQEEVFWPTASLLNLTVDLTFFDTQVYLVNHNALTVGLG